MLPRTTCQQHIIPMLHPPVAKTIGLFLKVLFALQIQTCLLILFQKFLISSLSKSTKQSFESSCSHQERSFRRLTFCGKVPSLTFLELSCILPFPVLFFFFPLTHIPPLLFFSRSLRKSLALKSNIISQTATCNTNRMWRWSHFKHLTSVQMSYFAGCSISKKAVSHFSYLYFLITSQTLWTFKEKRPAVKHEISQLTTTCMQQFSTVDDSRCIIQRLFPKVIKSIVLKARKMKNCVNYESPSNKNQCGSPLPRSPKMHLYGLTSADPKAGKIQQMLSFLSYQPKKMIWDWIFVLETCQTFLVMVMVSIQI